VPKLTHMQKPYLLTIAFCFVVLFSFSQTDESIVKSGSKGLYIEHKVAAKENFYSLGRTYNIHPKHLAAFNVLDMSKGLSLGQAINIPLSDSNFNRNASGGTPLYYKSALKQTVGAISAISKTPADNIRKWNNLANDIAPNSSVIIGYLITPGESPANKPVDVTEIKTATEEKKETALVQMPKQEEPKNISIVKKDTAKEEPKALQKEETAKNTTQSPVSITGDGYFKAHFAQQIKALPLSKDETVTSGIFKTTSGLKDGKYYALLDGVEPGTIIKVINPANSKAVYAKVLGQMNGIHQNQGLNLRISNAAASMLEIAETDKFILKVNY
jgi:hypothetical protein